MTLRTSRPAHPWRDPDEDEPGLAPLQADLSCEALVLGGGITGLTAARLLRDRGAEVVLLEARTCGAGATGRSSGFVTPDSELQVAQLVRRYGVDGARRLWRTGMAGCDEIRADAEAMPGRGRLEDADCLFVAARPSGRRAIRAEHEARRAVGLDSEICSAAGCAGMLGGARYEAGLRYGRTFGIDPGAYVAGLRAALRRRGVRIFENSRVIALGRDEARTASGRVRAARIFVCLDRFAPELGVAPGDISFAQTFLLLSEPLGAAAMDSIFPAGPFLVWDTDLIYHYVRRTPDHRLLIGGGNLCETYRRAPRRPGAVVAALEAYARDRLRLPDEVRFDRWWPGAIGVSKDFLPLAGRSPRCENHGWALCGAGLPWSVVAARTAVEMVLDGGSDLEHFLAPSRAFSTIEPLQPLLRSRLTFAVSHYLAKRY